MDRIPGLLCVLLGVLVGLVVAYSPIGDHTPPTHHHHATTAPAAAPRSTP